MEFDLTKHRFYNFPQPLKKSDYQEVCDLAVNNLRNNPNIKSLYLVGAEGVPGISDIDIAVVYNNKIEDNPPLEAPRNLSDKAKYIFLHNYASYNEQSFRNLYYLIPCKDNIKLLWGKETPVRRPRQELSQKDYQFLSAMVIFDLLIKKLLPFPRRFMARETDVRGLLSELYSLTYTLEMMEIVSGKKEGGDFPTKIKQLKNHWFEGNPQENLKELVSLQKEGVGLILEILVKLDNFVKNQSLPTDHSIIFKNNKYYVIFDQEWSKEKFLQKSMSGHITIRKPFSKKTVENFKLVLPPHLSYFLMAWANYQGPLSNWIKKGLLHYQKPSFLPVPEGIERRIASTNDLVQASIDNDGLFKIDYHYGLLVGKRTITSRIGEKLILFLRNIKK